MRREKAAGRIGRGKSRRARQNGVVDTMLLAIGDQQRTRIADTRHARIAHVDDIPIEKRWFKRLQCFGFVVTVE